MAIVHARSATDRTKKNGRARAIGDKNTHASATTGWVSFVLQTRRVFRHYRGARQIRDASRIEFRKRRHDKFPSWSPPPQLSDRRNETGDRTREHEFGIWSHDLLNVTRRRTRVSRIRDRKSLNGFENEIFKKTYFLNECEFEKTHNAHDTNDIVFALPCSIEPQRITHYDF